MVGPGVAVDRSKLAAAVTEATGISASAAEPDRIAYARDLWPRHHLGVRDGRIAPQRPGAVAWPENKEQLCALCAWCASRGVAIVPFGAGSGVCGAILPSPQALVVDLKKMRSYHLDEQRRLLSVESGVLGIRLEEELAPLGWTVGHFPSSILCSTVGGWIAARGAGQCSGRYGKIEDMVASLDCVDGRGQAAVLRRRARGPDLTPLWIGSEGVLGPIAACELRLHPAPEERGFVALSFATLEAGCEAIRRIDQQGLRPAVSRLYDPFDSMLAKRGARRGARPEPGRGRQRPRGKRVFPGLGALALRQALRVPGAMNAIVDALSSAALGGAMLVLVFEGDRSEVRSGVERARIIGKNLGGEDLGEEPARHWLAHRYSVSYRQAPMLMAGAFVDTMEVAAPWSLLMGLYRAVREALGRRAFVMAHLSHAYPDGCSIYFTFAGAAADDLACERAYDRTWRDALDAAIAAGGTLSHHHGVGRSKAPKLAAEIGAGVDLVAALRRAADPAGIFNPGNLQASGDPAGWRFRPLPSAPPRPHLDPTDQLVHASGAASLREIEEACAAGGLSLDLHGAPMDMPLSDWLAAGAAGAPNPWHDPVDHLVAGFSALLASGAALVIRPCPRRAAGPDLFALFHGAGGRVGRIHSAALRARDPDHRAPELSAPFAADPPIDAAEREWIDRVLGACGGT